MKKLILFGLLYFLEKSSGSISDIHNFDIIYTTDFTRHINKRSVNDKNVRLLEFSALKKKFRLYLQRGSDVIADNLVVKRVDGHNNEQIFNYADIENLYHGYLIDEPGTSSASVVIDDDGLLTAQIKAVDDWYIVEPARPHIQGIQNNSMIVYRASDLQNVSESRFCGYVKETLEKMNQVKNFTQASSYQDVMMSGRIRREAVLRNTCPLILVADYRFYQNVAQGHMSKAVSYLISLFDWINDLYRQINFGNGMTGFGFQIKEIRIHDSPSIVSSGSPYNEERDSWATQDLLEAFSRDQYFSQFCLAHLFTHQSFAGGVLGLAYIASPREYSVGGMCSPQFYKNGRKLYLNTGWSSSLNAEGRRLLTQEAYLVTAHELGHNWGSEHDPDTKECSPSSTDGGKYIMYTYSVSGFDANNKIFSPCSKRAMSNVLLTKSSVCFKDNSGQFCGNGRVELSEDCDAGPLNNGNDPCCDLNCKFKSKAICSDANSVCCTNCQWSDKRKKCHEAEIDSCDSDAFCTTGTSAHCPKTPSDPNQNDKPCLSQSGKCRNGTCVPLCETLGYTSCMCDKEIEQSCQLCCKKSNSTCFPLVINNNYQNLPDGTPCIQGFCKKGICKKVVANTIQRYWDIIEDLHPHRLGQLMKANIVGTVIILSLLIWIPISCIVCQVDKKREKEHRELETKSLQATLVRPNVRQSRKPIVSRSPNIDFLYSMPPSASPLPDLPNYRVKPTFSAPVAHAYYRS